MQSAQAFKTQSAWVDGWGSISSEGETLEISYSPTDEQYSIKLPSASLHGKLQPIGGNGSYDQSGWINLASTNSEVITDGDPKKLFVSVTLDWPATSQYSYTSFGSWYGARPFGEDSGVFAYGIPTDPNDVPVTGNASYSGEVRGYTNGLPETSGGGVGPILAVSGSVALSFDFGAGTLSGEMRPKIALDSGAISLGSYTFRDTAYSTGSSVFSGAFVVPGSNADSSFSGSLTGPQAAELMANWIAPFQHPGSAGWGTMAGVWVGKKN